MAAFEMCLILELSRKAFGVIATGSATASLRRNSGLSRVRVSQAEARRGKENRKVVAVDGGGLCLSTTVIANKVTIHGMQSR